LQLHLYSFYLVHCRCAVAGHTASSQSRRSTLTHTAMRHYSASGCCCDCYITSRHMVTNHTRHCYVSRSVGSEESEQ